jgi:AcrR family transcriptional regulator
MTQWKLTKESLDQRFREFLGDEGDTSPQARRRMRILRAAHALFLAQGYRKTSIDDIARKAEVGKGTVYLYFENKANLLVHTIALEKKVLVKQLEPLLDGSIPERERLPYYLRFVLTCARDLPMSTRLMTGDAELFAVLEEVGGAQVKQNWSESAGWVMDLIELAAPGVFDDDEKRRRADALVSIGMLGAYLQNDMLRAGRTLDELAATLSDMLVYGTVNRPPSGEP